MNKRQIVLIALLCAGVVGCNRPAQSKHESMPAASSQPAVEFELTDTLRARLAAADAADGKTDHLIEKCIGCGLGMAGKPAFTSSVGDYRAQFCSAGCKEAFESDPSKALTELKVPAH